MKEDSLVCIEIKEAHFFAYHGLYEQEKKTGNRFLVDVSVYYHPAENNPIEHIEKTVDYAKLFQIVSKEMAIPRNLLETVAFTICGKIKEVFPKVYEVKVTISKINPPIPDFSGRVSVTYTKRFPTL